MLAFGTTDYRRPADAIVVLGARAYADGRPSWALEDRVRTACEMWHEGRAPVVVMSGGPGDGAVHETEAMRRLALDLGVPDAAIRLDRDGVSTRATAANAAGLPTALVVTHAYHLPRTKTAFERRGVRAFTVPAEQRRVIRRMPWMVAREVAAWWWYAVAPA
jgi:vancomycin permeability regulator SanA